MDFANHPAFKHLDAAQVEDLASACEVVERSAKQEIIRRGERGDAVFFLLEGELEVYVDGKERQLITALHPPAVVGEMELLTDQPRSATVAAKTDAKLLSLPFEAARERMREGDPATLKVIGTIASILAKRLARTLDILAEIADRPTRVRSEELDDFRKKLFSDWSS